MNPTFEGFFMFSMKIVYARVEASLSGGIQQLCGQEDGEGVP